MKRIYLDYAASTPILPEALVLMSRYFLREFGNAGSLHSYGQAAIKAVDEAREAVSGALGAEFLEIVFTASATEANNLVLRGTVSAFRLAYPERVPRIIVSNIEHDSVLETAYELEKEGVILSIVKADGRGIVSAGNVARLLHEDTVLVSVMHGNNEIGTVQSIHEIAEVVADFRTQKGQALMDFKKSDALYPLFHTDAAQTFQYLSCDARSVAFDFMTLSGHKLFGPKGVGALYARNKMKRLRNVRSVKGVLRPIIFGGGQEHGLRAGTENVALIAGFGKAVSEALRKREESYQKVFEIRKFFIEKLESNSIEARIFNADQPDELTLPHIVSVFFPGRKAQDLLVALDLQGVAVSSGSACSMRSVKQSHVLTAVTEDEGMVLGTLRFSFSTLTTKNEILGAVKALKKILQQ